MNRRAFTRGGQTLLLYASLALSAVPCAAQPAASEPATPPPSKASAASAPVKINDDDRIHNVFRIHERVYSGGQPIGDAGFQLLKELGIKTVISVDGAKPDVARAAKFGLRYVHLPHGYNGVPAGRAAELAKAVRELDAPIFIHCHHGKHRSPAASAVACVTAGLIPPEASLPILAAAGTSKSYRGLYESAEEARAMDPAVLEQLAVEFKQVAEVPAMADAMVQIEHRHDHLKQLAANGWELLPEHPDVAPAHEALMLREHLTELLRTDEVQQQPPGFRKLLQQGEQHAQSLEEAYRQWRTARTAERLQRLNGALEAVNKNCVTCHAEFRDVPLDEKGR